VYKDAQSNVHLWLHGRQIQTQKVIPISCALSVRTIVKILMSGITFTNVTEVNKKHREIGHLISVFFRTASPLWRGAKIASKPGKGTRVIMTAPRSVEL